MLFTKTTGKIPVKGDLYKAVDLVILGEGCTFKACIIMHLLRCPSYSNTLSGHKQSQLCLFILAVMQFKPAVVLNKILFT